MSRLDTIQAYYRCYRERDRATLERILTPDLHHRSPWATYTDRDAMLDEIWPHVGKTWAVNIEVFSNGDDYIVTYEHHSEPGAGKHEGTMVERIHFSGDAIDRIDVYPPVTPGGPQRS